MKPSAPPLPAALMLTIAISGCFSSYEALEPEPTTSTSSDATSSEADSGSSAPFATSTSSLGPSSDDDAIDPETTSGSTTGELGCTVPDGTLDPSCPEDTPFCQSGLCVGCTALPPDHCASLDPSSPHCDPELGVCTGCSVHEQCPSGACQIRTGHCFPVEQQLWVDGDDPQCATGDGTSIAPLCTIDAALDIVASRPAGEAWVVKVDGRPEPYVGTLAPSGGHPLAIVGRSSQQRPRIDGDGIATIDLFAPDIELYLHALDVQHTSGGAQTVRCAFGNELWASDVGILGGPGLVLANCSVTLESSLVQGGDVRIGPDGGLLAMLGSVVEQGPNDELLVRADALLSRTHVRRTWEADGIRLDDAQAHLVLDNSIVQGDAGGPVLFIDSGQVDAAFSTIIGGVGCANPGPSTIRSSIVMGLACGSVGVDHSLVDTGAAQGTGNALLPPDALPALFVDPSGALGDYHVLPGSLAEDVAIWANEDAPIDIDGDTRPGRPRAPDYAGADVP